MKGWRLPALTVLWVRRRRSCNLPPCGGDARQATEGGAQEREPALVAVTMSLGYPKCHCGSLDVGGTAPPSACQPSPPQGGRSANHLSLPQSRALHRNAKQRLPRQRYRQIRPPPRLQHGRLQPVQRAAERLDVPALQRLLHQLAPREKHRRAGARRRPRRRCGRRSPSGRA